MNNKKDSAVVFSVLFLLMILSSANGFPAESSPLWSFAVIADPHIQGSPEHMMRLRDSVDWINQNKESKLIRLVFVLGDIAWGKEGEHLREAKNTLDGLDIPYIPLIGDNENNIDPFGELYFAEIFEPQYLLLSTILKNWKKAPVCAWNPELERYCYFQNFSFDYRDVHFVATDWSSRKADDADLHNFPGGTWPWFVDDIASCQKNKNENIVVLSHPPMCHYLGLARYSLTPPEFSFMKDFTAQYSDHIYANFAGHLHVNGVMDVKNSGGYKVYLTDGTFDDENSVRIVFVLCFGQRFYYFHTIHELDQEGTYYRRTKKYKLP